VVSVDPAAPAAGRAAAAVDPVDGTTHLVMSPLAFMQRRAALVPRPRPHPIRFHGVLAPNCGGELKIITAILEQPVIEKILTHLGLQARVPPRAPAHRPQLQAA
jgi:hypothetical protein